MKRPEPGEKTVNEVRVRLCRKCHRIVDETGLCTYNCPNDDDHDGVKTYFVAVYRKTMEFLRDEDADK